MRLNFLLVLIFCFSSCIQNISVSIFKTADFIIADTNSKATDYLNFNQKNNNYAIYYMAQRWTQ
jgi:hypothetical protein